MTNLRVSRCKLPPAPQRPLPSAEVDIYHLREYSVGQPWESSLQYLHMRRRAMWRCHEHWILMIRKYFLALPEEAKALAMGIQTRVPPSLIVQVASRDSEADLYFYELVAACQKPHIDRHHWRKDSSYSAGSDQSKDAGTAYRAIEWIEVPPLPAQSRVVIMDDVYASGKTVAATWARLLDAGLQPDVEVVVAAPLLVQ